MQHSAGKPILLFDGVCNLCNEWVNFIIDHDPEARILYAPLQSRVARQLLGQHKSDFTKSKFPNSDTARLTFDSPDHPDFGISDHTGSETDNVDPGKMYNLNSETVILLDGGNVYVRSDAILQLAGHLGGVIGVLRLGRLIPRFIRDAVYNWIARNRYVWFGKREACRVPEPGIRERFLEMNNEQ